MTGTDGSVDCLCQQATAATTRDYRLSYKNMVNGDLRVLRIDRPLSRAKYFIIIICCQLAIMAMVIAKEQPFARVLHQLKVTSSSNIHRRILLVL